MLYKVAIKDFSRSLKLVTKIPLRINGEKMRNVFVINKSFQI